MTKETQTTRYDSDYVQGIEEGIKRSSFICDKTRSQIRLACGELSAQEMRTAQAVLGWIQSEIRGQIDEL